MRLEARTRFMKIETKIEKTISKEDLGCILFEAIYATISNQMLIKMEIAGNIILIIQRNWIYRQRHPNRSKVHLTKQV